MLIAFCISFDSMDTFIVYGTLSSLWPENNHASISRFISFAISVALQSSFIALIPHISIVVMLLLPKGSAVQLVSGDHRVASFSVDIKVHILQNRDGLILSLLLFKYTHSSRRGISPISVAISTATSYDVDIVSDLLGGNAMVPTTSIMFLP